MRVAFVFLALLVAAGGFWAGTTLGDPPRRAEAASLDAEPIPVSSNQITAPSEHRSAKEILRDFDSLRLPSVMRADTEEQARENKRRFEALAQRKCDLAQELLTYYPEHRRLPRLLFERWSLINNTFEDPQRLIPEITAVIENPETRRAIRKEAVFARARSAVIHPDLAWAERRAWIEAAITFDPKDELGGYHLAELAKYHTSDAGSIRELCERVVAKWPKSEYATRAARSHLKVLDRVGTRLPPLEFTDVVSGDSITEAGLRGKPVIVLVWSGLYDTMKGEIEEMKAFRKTERARTVHVVSPYNWKHEGGVEGLRQKLIDCGVDWPHMYEEAKFDKPWTGDWAVPETPTYFLLDADGQVTWAGFRLKNLLPNLQ